MNSMDFEKDVDPDTIPSTEIAYIQNKIFCNPYSLHFWHKSKHSLEMKIKKTKILPTSVVKHYSFLTILETHIFKTDVTLRLLEKPPHPHRLDGYITNLKY